MSIEGAVATPDGAPAGPELSGFGCPNCGRPLAARKGRFGPFLGCTGYPGCKTIINLDKEGNPKLAEGVELRPYDPDAVAETPIVAKAEPVAKKTTSAAKNGTAPKVRKKAAA